MTGRTEARYIARRIDTSQIRRKLPLGGFLEYGVENFYLDEARGEFSASSLGAPRLRLRLYSAESFLFGQLECKRQIGPTLTIKRRWPAATVWDEACRLIPALRRLSLCAPPADHPLGVLSAGLEGGAPDVTPQRFTKRLRFARLSCALSGAHLTFDSSFEPPIVSSDRMIVEAKVSSTTLAPHVLASFELETLNASKFALLEEYTE